MKLTKIDVNIRPNIPYGLRSKLISVYIFTFSYLIRWLADHSQKVCRGGGEILVRVFVGRSPLDLNRGRNSTLKNSFSLFGFPPVSFTQTLSQTL